MLSQSIGFGKTFDVKRQSLNANKFTSPGLHVAERSVLINVGNFYRSLASVADDTEPQTALLNWSFKMLKKTDDQGREIDIDTLAFSNSANSHPLPGMPVRFVPRFEGVEDQIGKMEGWA